MLLTGMSIAFFKGFRLLKLMNNINPKKKQEEGGVKIWSDGRRDAGKKGSWEAEKKKKRRSRELSIVNCQLLMVNG